MSLRARTRRLTALALAAATLATLGLTAPAQASTPPGLNYAALGDSYSAGSGVFPISLGAPIQCIQSQRNYPKVLAARIGAQLTDVTCGGARTQDFTSPQFLITPPQANVLSADTDLVTMTIGGNDEILFAAAVAACGTAAVTTLGQGHPCQNLYGAFFEDVIDDKIYPKLVGAMDAVRTKAPNARVAAIGYPWIVPPRYIPGCTPQMPVATGDIAYLHGIQAHLNSAVQRAADATGVTFVDMSAVTAGHDACQPRDQRWMEPLLIDRISGPVHPNAKGEQAMADQVAATLGLD